MRYQVVITGLDSKEALTIQREINFPLTLQRSDLSCASIGMHRDIRVPVAMPKMDSFGGVIIDGLVSSFEFGGKWVAILDAHADGVSVKKNVSASDEAELIASEAEMGTKHFAFVECTAGILDAIARAACAIYLFGDESYEEIDARADLLTRVFDDGSSPLIIDSDPASVIVFRGLSAKNDFVVFESLTKEHDSVRLNHIVGEVGLTDGTGTPVFHSAFLADENSLIAEGSAKASGLLHANAYGVLGVLTSAANASIFRFLRGSNKMLAEAACGDSHSSMRLDDICEMIGVPDANAFSTLLSMIAGDDSTTDISCESSENIAQYSSGSSACDVFISSAGTILRLVCVLQEHDDKHLVEMDVVSLFDLSYKEIDD